VEEIGAFKEGEMYVLHISGLKFSRRILASAQPYGEGKNTLNYVFYKLIRRT